MVESGRRASQPGSVGSSHGSAAAMAASAPGLFGSTVGGLLQIVKIGTRTAQIQLEYTPQPVPQVTALAVLEGKILLHHVFALDRPLQNVEKDPILAQFAREFSIILRDKLIRRSQERAARARPSSASLPAPPARGHRAPTPPVVPVPSGDAAVEGEMTLEPEALLVGDEEPFQLEEAPLAEPQYEQLMLPDDTIGDGEGLLEGEAEANSASAEDEVGSKEHTVILVEVPPEVERAFREMTPLPGFSSVAYVDDQGAIVRAERSFGVTFDARTISEAWKEIRSQVDRLAARWRLGRFRTLLMEFEQHYLFFVPVEGVSGFLVVTSQDHAPGFLMKKIEQIIRSKG